MKCYKRLIYKQFVHVSGLCVPKFLSYLPKRFTLLCRALYGDAILVHRMAAGNHQKHLEFTFSITLEMVILLKIKRRGFFSTRQHSYFGVTHCGACEDSEGQIAVFSKCRHATGMETCTKVYFLFIFNLVLIRIGKSSLFWQDNLMTSLWKPSVCKRWNTPKHKVSLFNSFYLTN